MFSLLMFSLFACGDKDRSFIFGSDSEDSGGYVAPPSDTSAPEMNLPAMITSINVEIEATLTEDIGDEEFCEDADRYQFNDWDYIDIDLVVEDPNGPDDIVSVFLAKEYWDTQEDRSELYINDYLPATFDGLKWSFDAADLAFDSKGVYYAILCAYDAGGLGHCYGDGSVVSNMANTTYDQTVDCF